MLVTKASSLQTRAREPLSIYRTHHYGQIRCQLHILLPMSCRISLHFCALLFKYCFKHPNSKYIWLLIRSLMLWRLDPWLIDYGGVSWLAFNMWTITSLASLIKVQIRLRTCVQIMRPGATRSKSFDNCRGWSWCGRDCFPNYSIACSCDDQLAHCCTMFPCYLGTDFQCRHPIWTEQWQRLSSLATN